MIKLIQLIICLNLFACSFEDGYLIQNESVHFQQPSFKDLKYNIVKLKIKDVDIKTFKILKDGYYAKDKNNVYYKEKTINNADSNTFIVLSDLIGKDKNSGFFMGKYIVDSDGLTFQKLEGLYSKDKNNIYYGEKIISHADVNSFKIVDQKLSVSKDKNFFYDGAVKLPIRDYPTFAHVQEDFWKDKHHVYHLINIYNIEELIVQDIDSKTVKATKYNGIIQDKHGCHNGYDRVKCR